MGKAKPATGLTVSRSGDYLICNWSQGEKSVTKQEMLIAINGYPVNWEVRKSDTASAVYMHGWGGPITAFNFAVREKGSDKWSDWAGSPMYYFGVAHAPKVTATLNSATRTTFHVEVPSSDSDYNPTSGFKWESVLGKDGKADWSNATRGTVAAFSGDIPFNETGFGSGNYCYVRWFRACGYGYVGNSGWVYSKHVYAIPNPARNVTASYKELVSGAQISANWQSDVSDNRPIDSVFIRYLYQAPVVTFSESGNTMKMSLSAPNTSSGWTDLQETGGAGGKRSASATISTKLDADMCAFVRVDNKHDTNSWAYGTAVLASGGTGRLSTPSFNGEITPGGQGMERLYTITVNRNTTINNAAIAIHYRTENNQNLNKIIGVIPPTGSGRYTGNTIQVWIPQLAEGDAPSFGVRAFIGDYTPLEPSSSNEPTYYTVKNVKMESGTNWAGGSVPQPPSITLSQVPNKSDTVQVAWNWSWTVANSAEISWADHDDAWYSTDEPSTYIVTNDNISRWNVTGLSLDKWYFRVRLMRKVQDVTTYGTYSNMESITLSSSPNIPRLLLQPSVISKTGSTTGTWAFESNDGTSQMSASIYEAFYTYEAVSNPSGNPIEKGYYELVDGQYVRSLDTSVVSGKTYYTPTGEITYSTQPIDSTSTSQHITLRAEDHGWLPGETHYLALQLVSSAGTPTDKLSAPVPIQIADELVAEITQHSFVDVSETDDPDWTLTEYPITATTTGAGTGGTTTYTIERDADYVIRRPNDTDYYGFEGETIAIKTVSGEDQVSIDKEDLLGVLDDNAKYRLIATVTDTFGQVDTQVLKFRVAWAHQAITPSATLSIDAEQGVSFITPVKPSGWVEGDVADIYRLSADAPELIVKDGEFGTKYVDPYPTYGDFGGYRVVYRTINGDYIDNRVLAMTDYTAEDHPEIRHDKFGIVIDFNGDQIILPYNVSLTNSWTKDFIKTTYLGGTIQGDWNPVIERSSTANTVIPIEVEPDQVNALRRLANYAGICHVRTPDSSSFNADVQVKDDREEKWTHRLSKVSLTITKVDYSNLDGMTYEQWVERQTPELDEP